MRSSTTLSHLRAALLSLGDLEQLGRNPLTAHLGPVGSADETPAVHLDRAAYLRDLLIKSIEDLRPSDETDVSSSEWRQFVILHDRYVLRRSLWQVQEKLHLGERQVRREHRRALTRLAVQVQSDLAKAASGVMDNKVNNAPPPAMEQLLDDPQESEAIRAAQRLTPEPSVFGVRELFEDLRAILFEVTRHTDRVNTISWSIVSDDLTIYTDRGILHQLLFKLLQSLVRHMQTDAAAAAVTVAAVGRDDLVRLTIQGYLKSADPLGVTQPEPPPLCRWLARILQTDLQCRVDEAGSCTIALELPKGTRLWRVLLIDDEPLTTELFRSYLSGMNYHVMALTRPSDALDQARDLRPDVILLDVMMPAVDGWELLQRFRLDQVLQGVPVIVCSVLRDVDLALALGAAAFLHKPVLRQQLITTLAKVLGR
jgi:CheY-like chemotaxis protein